MNRAILTVTDDPRQLVIEFQRANGDRVATLDLDDPWISHEVRLTLNQWLLGGSLPTDAVPVLHG